VVGTMGENGGAELGARVASGNSLVLGGEDLSNIGSYCLYCCLWYCSPN
jgi:hypothetical protein